jgi:hypothetical protein
VGLRAVLDVVVKRKIPRPRRESNPRAPIVQSVAFRRKVIILQINPLYMSTANPRKTLLGLKHGLQDEKLKFSGRPCSV